MFPPATPHGPFLDVAPGVRAVRGTFSMGPGVVISRTMTVVESDDGPCVINSVRLNAQGEAELTRRGPIRHVIKLADGHGVDDPYMLKDGATFWSTPQASHPKIPRGRTLGPDAPVPGMRVIALPGTTEAALWVPAGGGTLITCDVVQHHVDTEGASWLARQITPLLGFRGAVLVAAPMWRRVKKLDLAGVRRATAPLLDVECENLITGHGPPIVGGAGARLREAIQALV
jgi:hypothetical protein